MKVPCDLCGYPDGRPVHCKICGKRLLIHCGNCNRESVQDHCEEHLPTSENSPLSSAALGEASARARAATAAKDEASSGERCPAKKPPTYDEQLQVVSEQLRTLEELIRWGISIRLKDPDNPELLYLDPEYILPYLFNDIANLQKKIESKKLAKEDVSAFQTSWKKNIDFLKRAKAEQDKIDADEAEKKRKIEENRLKSLAGVERKQAEERRAQMEKAREEKERKALRDRGIVDACRNAPPDLKNAARAVCFVYRSGVKVDGIMGVSGDAGQFFRRSEGKVVYTGKRFGDRRDKMIDDLVGALNQKDRSQMAGREVWVCAEVDAAVQLAMQGIHFSNCSFITVISEEDVAWRYLQVCDNCAMSFSELGAKK